MEKETELISQADFAKKMNVSRAAVSQWKLNNILGDEAFTKPGKKGKLIYAIATEHVRLRRDIGQSLGNGIATKTTADSLDQTTTAQEAVPDTIVSSGSSEASVPIANLSVAKTDTVEDRLKNAKLEEQLRRNRLQAMEEAVSQSRLMSASAVRADMTRIAGSMLQIFESALTDFSVSLAKQFDIPQRDVQHFLKNEFRKVRETAAMKQRVLAESTAKEEVLSLGDEE